MRFSKGSFKLESNYYIVIIILGLLILALLWMISFAININRFTNELKYVNLEIGRTRGAERKHWLKRRRRLILSAIFFFI